MRISLCLLLFSVVHGGGCKETEVAAIAGKSVQLQPVRLPEPRGEIIWKVRLDSAVTYRILTFNESKLELGAASHFTKRVTFHNETLSLLIDPVQKSDSGLYSLVIDIGGGREDIRKFRLSVFDQVGKPNLTLLSAHLEPGHCNVTLSCSAPGADNITYSWSRGTSLILPVRVLPSHEHQSLLQVVINADSSDASFTCKASNQVSWDVNTVDVKTPCSSPATAPTPGVMRQDIFDVVPLWVLVTGVGVLLLLVLSLIFLCKHRKKKRKCKDVDQALTIYEEVNDVRTRRNSNRTAQSRIVGNTIYAEVTSNLPMTDVTVYAAVQRPRSIKKQKIDPALLSTIYMEVQGAPSRPRDPQKQRSSSSSPSPGHLYS
ncbi:natural killer cell receptor 2B4 [Emydura macquarii macquarii]|uniref:natural killer cell receptor 2B4 n=1 Tax=Emydura macquarii macquarii TaxID=1129001 RepID=UPI003529ED88